MARAAPTLILVVAAAVGLACPADDEDAAQPFFPEDYEDSYREVRPCRPSGDHDLNNVRILADAAALAPYQQRSSPFPLGAVVLKQEYDFGDLDCTGEIKQWTVMRKLADGSSPETLGWAWQRVDLARRVLEPDAVRCISCHQGCGVPPDGYDWTCSVP
jgi:Cytochrome P460